MDTKTVIKYIIGGLDDVVNEETLVPLLGTGFYEDLVRLKELYERIDLIYNDKTASDHFLAATAENILVDTRPTFTGFEESHVFVKFYSLFLDLVKRYGSSPWESIHSQMIKNHLNEDTLNEVVIKYDYYFSHRLKFTVNQEKITDFGSLPSGKGFYILSHKRVSVYNFKYELVSEIEFQNYGDLHFFLSPEGRDMAFIQLYQQQQIVILDVYTGHETLTIPDPTYHSHLKILHGQRLVTIQETDLITFDITTGEERVLLSDKKGIKDFFLLDDNRIITFNYGGITLWDSSSEMPLLMQPFPNNNYMITVHQLSKDVIMFQQVNRPWMIWNLHTNQLTQFYFEGGYRKKITFLPGGNFLVIGSEDQLHMFTPQLYTFRLEKFRHIKYFMNIIPLPNHQVLVSDEKEAVLWNTQTLTVDRVIYFPKHTIMKLLSDGTIGMIVSDPELNIHGKLQIYE